MRTFHSYEDIAWANAAQESAPVHEAFAGSSIVRWYNTIRFGLKEKIAKQEANRNQEYAALLRTYSNLWDKHAITGSMNVETIQLLKAAAEPYATMDWNEQKYFVGIVTSLDELLADQEAFPSGADTEQNMPMVGGGAGGPPLGTDFGPEKNTPPGMGGGAPGEEGMPGGPGGPEGATAAPGGPTPLPGAEEPGAPGEENTNQRRRPQPPI